MSSALAEIENHIASDLLSSGSVNKAAVRDKYSHLSM